MSKMNKGEDKVYWSDRKRIMGLPISFTKYSLFSEKFICDSGLFNSSREMIMLYRILDIKLERTFTQKIFGVGSLYLHTSDQTAGEFVIKNVKEPEMVMDLLSDKVEEVRKRQRIKATEFMGDDFGPEDF